MLISTAFHLEYEPYRYIRLHCLFGSLVVCYNYSVGFISLIFLKEMKKFTMFSVLVVALLLVTVPVFAEDTTTATAPAATVSSKITCVGVAVAVREAALGVAVSAHFDAVKAAYATRVNELAGAYSNTTTATLKVGIKTAWADFSKSTKAAATTWRTSRNAAWSAFRTAAKACKANSSVTDSAHAGLELSGQ